jgi:hypothetical protein
MMDFAYVETHAFFAVGMHNRQQAFLPAAKTVPGHGTDGTLMPTMPTWMWRG